MSDDINCPECGGARVGVEIRFTYDGVLFWECVKCSHRWHRWTDTRMRAKAEPFVNKKKDE